MNLTFLRTLLARQEVRTILISTAIGGILQIMCLQFIKNHPELFDEKNGKLKEAEPGIKNKNRNPRSRGFFRRGGAMIELSTITVAITFLSETGLLGGLMTGTGLVLKKIPTSAISTYLREALPQNLPELGKKSFILVDRVDGGKICLDQCEQNLEYLFNILTGTTLPFEEKEKVTGSIFAKYVNLKTMAGRLNFVLCIVSILSVFAIHDIFSYHIILKHLMKAIKEGRISKVIGRAIIRILQKKGLPVNPELLDVIDS